MTQAANSNHPQPDAERVDVSGCLNGFRVWLDGSAFHDCTTASNAARVATHLRALVALGVFQEKI